MKSSNDIFDLPTTSSLPRIIGLIVVIFSLATPISAQSKNICETGASPTNPFAAVNSGIGGKRTENSGIGGTGGKIVKDGGIGGTGEKMTEDGGIGGTGIIGMITGFASICVSGVEIHYDANTSVFMDGSPSTIQDLTTGQVVVVRAEGFGDEVTAEYIAIMHAVVGPVTHIDHASQEIQVINQTIQIQPNYTEKLDSGDWVRISGHRLANGKVIASHIQSIQPLEQSIINGRIAQIDGNTLVVDGTHVELDPQAHPTSLSKGMEVSVKGNWNGSSIQAQAVQIAPTRHSLGNVEHIVMEGYVHAITEQTLQLHNQKIKIAPDAQITETANAKLLRLNQRIQVSGRLTDDSHVVADKVELKQTPFTNDIDGIHFNDSNRRSEDVEQASEKNTQNTAEPSKMHQNSQNDSHDADTDTHSEKSEHSSENLNSGKSEQSSDTPEISNSSGHDIERFNEDRDTDTPDEKSNGHSDRIEDLDRLDRRHKPDFIEDTQLDQDQDQDFDRDQHGDHNHDFDRESTRDHGMNPDHELNFDGDLDRDFDRDHDRDFDRDFEKDLDRDHDRNFDRDLDRDFDR